MNDETLLHRAKAHLPLYQLKDRLDYKQALIEVAFMHEASKLLELMPPNATKAQQKTVIHNFLEKRPLAGSEYNFPGFNSVKADGFKAHVVEAEKDKEMAQRFATIQCLYANDKELAQQTGYEATGILGKSLSAILKADSDSVGSESDFALYIFFFHQNFPEDLPELLEPAPLSVSVNNQQTKTAQGHFKELKTPLDWKIEFLKIALPEEIGNVGANLSEEQKHAECVWLRDAIYSQWDLNIKPLETSNVFYAAAFQPTFLEHVLPRFKKTIERLCQRLKNNPNVALPKWSAKEILEEEVNNFFRQNFEIWGSLPNKEQVTGCSMIAATALFKLSMLENFWIDFDEQSFFEGLSELTGNLLDTETNDLKIEEATADIDLPPAEGENTLNQSGQNEQQCPNNRSNTFYIGLDEFEEPQVYFGKQPFLRRGYDKHKLLKSLIEKGGTADIDTLSRDLEMDCDQFKAQVNAIKSDFKRIVPGHILLRLNQGKIRLDWEIEQNCYPKTTQI